MNYKGVIIEESLDNKSVLSKVKILETKVEKITPKHKTPWILQWTLDTVEISEENADNIATEISNSLDKQHQWYADYKNENYHYIIYRNKIFKVDLKNPVPYDDAREYGISIGIPEYQVNFAPKDIV
jgi:hypothetical protein